MPNADLPDKRASEQDWNHGVGRSNRQPGELALRAIDVDPRNAEALGIYAHFSAFLDKDSTRHCII